MKPIIFFFCLTGILFSCKSHTRPNDLFLMGLSEKTKSMEVQTLSKNYSALFNEKGNLVTEESSGSEGLLKKEYFYTDSGALKEIRSTTETETFALDSDDVAVSSVVKRSDGTQFQRRFEYDYKKNRTGIKTLTMEDQSIDYTLVKFYKINRMSSRETRIPQANGNWIPVLKEEFTKQGWESLYQSLDSSGQIIISKTSKYPDSIPVRGESFEVVITDNKGNTANEAWTLDHKGRVVLKKKTSNLPEAGQIKIIYQDYP